MPPRSTSNSTGCRTRPAGRPHDRAGAHGRAGARHGQGAGRAGLGPAHRRRGERRARPLRRVCHRRNDGRRNRRRLEQPAADVSGGPGPPRQRDRLRQAAPHARPLGGPARRRACVRGASACPRPAGAGDLAHNGQPDHGGPRRLRVRGARGGRGHRPVPGRDVVDAVPEQRPCPGGGGRARPPAPGGGRVHPGGPATGGAHQFLPCHHRGGPARRGGRDRPPPARPRPLPGRPRLAPRPRPGPSARDPPRRADAHRAGTAVGAWRLAPLQSHLGFRGPGRGGGGGVRLRAGQPDVRRSRSGCRARAQHHRVARPRRDPATPVWTSAPRTRCSAATRRSGR